MAPAPAAGVVTYSRSEFATFGSSVSIGSIDERASHEESEASLYEPLRYGSGARCESTRGGIWRPVSHGLGFFYP